MFDQTVHVVLNPIDATRAREFEEFMADVVLPAARAQRPELVGRMRMLKADTERQDAAVITYVFLFDGGSLTDEWDLESLLVDHYGQAEGARLLQQWLALFVAVARWREALGNADSDDPQVWWSCTPVVAAGTV